MDNSKKAQMSVELIVTVSIMVSLLIVIFIVNDNLSYVWARQKQRLEAGNAANQVAMAINMAASGGDGTQIRFTNAVGPSVSNITIYEKRAVLAYTSGGVSYSTPIVTNNTDVPGLIPFGEDILIINDKGVIRVGAG